MRRALGAWVMLLLAGHGAAAHEAFEITSLAQIDAGQLEMRVTMARSTAREACARDGMSVPSFEPAGFAEVRELFAARARRLYDVKLDGVPLTATAAEARLTAEQDVELRVTYPLPKRGSLRVEAVCLKNLPPEGYGGALTVLERGSGKLLLGTVISQEEPVRTVDLTPAEEVAAITPPPAVVSRRGNYSAPTVIVIVMGAAAILLLARRRAA